MASQRDTLDFILEQVACVPRVTFRKMFGEFAIYVDGKVVAFLCDDKLFLKPTKAGGEFIVNVQEGFPYPGSKPHFFISGELWDDSLWLSRLFVITSTEVLPSVKKPKKIKTK